MTTPPKQVRRRRNLLITVAIAALITLIAADRLGLLLVRDGDDMAAYDGATVRVVNVIDGDTIIVDTPDPLSARPVTTIRLWGIDAPERAHNNAPAEPLANEATQFARDLVHNTAVTLHLESHRTRGIYGRVLAHVDLHDGRCLNALLLEAGLAHLDERWPHDRLITYAQKHKAAQRAGNGLWANDN